MSHPPARSIVESWADALSRRDYDAAREMLAPACNVLLNGLSLDRDKYVNDLKVALSQSPVRVAVDLVIIDGNDPNRLAVRFIHRGEHQDGASQKQAEHAFVWVNQSGKITNIVAIVDDMTHEDSDRDVASSPTSPQRQAHHGGDLTQFYRDYIHTINSLTMKEGLEEFCQPVVTHNARRLSIDEYRLMIESSFDEIRGLHFSIEDIIVDDETQQIAARIGFTGVPGKAFRGIAPTGKEVRFSEHAYYRLEDGKIVRVRSVLDLSSYRRSILGGDGEA
ncbi:hypothetical protein PLIIFM63780_008011 [Purpureocillium lilacinum]|uniref:SnoaL-like polyketide cyclase n=1 Tax=Purpureocillium lilacinum TaxID=33203 RepID=A0ABR0BXL2_PURLI|nr:hypothetical protein Purlil1_7168 [Purpureocillium lilacinum]GJN84454.1 hypothetical protein PLIIFM63780_008011 [Purpureocillium lilacinum]